MVQSSSVGDDSVGHDEENNQESVNYDENWVMDERFVAVKKQRNIPDDPEDWTEQHVQIWLEWAIKQFDLRLRKTEWRMSGQQLCNLTLSVFHKMVLRDPGKRFWTHLELLRKYQFIAIPENLKSVYQKGLAQKKSSLIGGKTHASSSDKTISPSTSQGRGNRSGNNGQTELW